jgi:hypothetical protein
MALVLPGDVRPAAVLPAGLAVTATGNTPEFVDVIGAVYWPGMDAAVNEPIVMPAGAPAGTLAANSPATFEAVAGLPETVFAVTVTKAASVPSGICVEESTTYDDNDGSRSVDVVTDVGGETRFVAGSVAVAFTVVPSGNGLEGVHVNVPSALTVVVHTVAPVAGSVIVITSPPTLVPVNTEPSEGATVGEAGRTPKFALMFTPAVGVIAILFTNASTGKEPATVEVTGAVYWPATFFDSVNAPTTTSVLDTDKEAVNKPASPVAGAPVVV